jgi:hypothetical protein
MPATGFVLTIPSSSAVVNSAESAVRSWRIPGVDRPLARCSTYKRRTSADPMSLSRQFSHRGRALADVIPGYKPQDKIALCKYKPYPPQAAAR